MIPYQKFSKQILVLVSFFLVTLSCQDNVTNSELEIDEDMITATQLAEEYLNSSKGRQGSEKSITVLKYKDGQLLYSTNTDDYKSYQLVDEQTVTATAEPGEYVFWFSGGGVTDLDGIDFEDSTQNPEEINSNKMWVIEIPDDFDLDDDDEIYLKYDIIYQFKGNSGLPIRLDPKIKIQD